MNWANLLCGHEIASFVGKKAAEMRNREGPEVGTSGLHFSMACDLWSFEAIQETVSSVSAYLNSFIMLIVNYLVTYKNCQKFGWYKVLDLLINFLWAFFRTGDTGTELKPLTSGWLILKRT